MEVLLYVFMYIASGSIFLSNGLYLAMARKDKQLINSVYEVKQQHGETYGFLMLSLICTALWPYFLLKSFLDD